MFTSIESDVEYLVLFCFSVMQTRKSKQKIKAKRSVSAGNFPKLIIPIIGLKGYRDYTKGEHYLELLLFIKRLSNRSGTTVFSEKKNSFRKEISGTFSGYASIFNYYFFR